LAVSGISLRAESGTIPAAPPGVVDIGAPSFVVFGQDSLGFSSPPSDMHLLPDGRVLVVSQREIAIGDGVRWETYQEAADQNGYIFSQVAVDDDGRIYVGSSGGIARIDLGEDARWRLVPVVSSPLADPFRFVAQFPDTWLWYSGGGSILAWRPGQPVQASELSHPIKHVFAVGKERFASASDSGQLFRLHLGGEAELVPPARTSISDTVTCSMDYGPDEILVGTVGSGIRAFDGRSFSTVSAPKLLKSKQRIDALCRLGTDSYAATVDTTGIVVLDRDGRIIQVLNRTLDHRLARAQRLLFSPTGVLWALLDNAVACVQFSSSVSNFESILASAMDYSRPLRYKGVLWMLTDGRLTRGVYAPDGYLDHFENDSPPGGFIWAVSEPDGRLFATNGEGIFLRDTTGWIQIASGIVNARVGIGRARSDGRLFYLARGEIGWIKETSGRYDVERIPVKGLGEVFNAVEDAAGAIWLELGTNRAGRVEFGAGPPTVRFFGEDDGLVEGWPNLFILDGKLECSGGGHLLEFDASSQRFEESRDLARRIPALVDCAGRPTRDAAGRLWFSYHGTVCYVDDTKVRENPPLVSLPLGFEATEFNMESGGSVWMQSKGHLIRFDPDMPHLPPVPLRAQITSVLLATSDHHLFNLGPTLPPIPYSDNSLVVRFAAVSSPFDPPVSFDVRLDGANDRWVSTGNAGSASFNRLKEGRYVFHVRPVRNGEPGEEARLAFTVLPQWFRTKLAWVTYLIVAAGLGLLVAWTFSFLQHREMARLERLVVERTAELNYTNTRLGRQVAETTAALGASEERYRHLNTELESRVAQRTEELSTTNENLKREIAERQQAEVEKARLQEQLAHAQKMESVGRLAGGVAHDFNNMLQAILGNVGLALDNVPPGTPVRENLEEIQKSAEHSAELTRQLLAFARKQTIQPKVLDLNETVAGMLKMLHRLIGEDIHLDWVPGAGVWPVKVDPSQIDQVLANLCVNARDAIGWRRHDRHRHEQRDPGPVRSAGASRVGPGRLCAAVRERQRQGHGRRHAPPPVRTVLHHQGSGKRDGAGSGHGVWRRRPEPGIARRRQRARPGNDLQNLPAACKDRSRGCGAGILPPFAARHRDGAAGGGRGTDPEPWPPDSAALRIHGAGLFDASGGARACGTAFRADRPVDHRCRDARNERQGAARPALRQPSEAEMPFHVGLHCRRDRQQRRPRRGNTFHPEAVHGRPARGNRPARVQGGLTARPIA
jgi:signal transduction histidine kinase